MIVKKAGGKYKMLPLFYETTTKIREVSLKLLVHEIEFTHSR
jgi:hypothetical protein